MAQALSGKKSWRENPVVTFLPILYVSYFRFWLGIESTEAKIRHVYGESYVWRSLIVRSFFLSCFLIFHYYQCVIVLCVVNRITHCYSLLIQYEIGVKHEKQFFRF